MRSGQIGKKMHFSGAPGEYLLGRKKKNENHARPNKNNVYTIA